MKEKSDSPVQVPRPGDWVFKFQEVDPPNRTVAFTNVDIVPRSYDELAAARLHEPLTIRLEMFNGRILETDVEGVDTELYAHLSATVKSPFTARAIGLVHGGWLPSGIAATKSGAVVFPDRNVVSAIVSRFNKGDARGNERDFLDLFAEASITLNPMLFAFEGNGRMLPDPDLLRAQLAEAVEKLGRALPRATILAGSELAEGLLGLVEDSRPGLARKQAFLQKVAPLIAAPVAGHLVETRWNEVIAAADVCGVERASLIVLAALSSVVNPAGGPARRLLKLRAKYDDARAYNALADLRSLELLLYALALQPGAATQLCTADRALALFWTGAGFSSVMWEGNGIRYQMTPHEALLPEPFAERWRDSTTQQ